jgi:serine/threonine-protein kinase HipA
MTPLDELRAVSAADVWKKDLRVARLSREPGVVVFDYLPEVRARGAPAVATTLPVAEEAVRTTGGAIPPFFAGLLPEGRRLTSLRRAVKTSADDELSLVLAVGADTVGDVRVLAPGAPREAPAPLVTVRKTWSETRFSDLLAEAGMVDLVALPGVQDKVSGGVISLPVARAHERYIVKLDPPEYPHLVENEAFFLAAAREARLPAASGELVRDAEGRPGLVVRRFDRARAPDGTVAARACEDGCQVLGRWPADKYLVSTEEVVRGLAALCAARAVALRDLFRQVLFAWLTGNGDLHAKNLSILETDQGEWRVAPAYDVPSTLLYGDRTSAMSMRGKNDGFSRRHWLLLAEDVELPARAAEREIDDLLARTASLAGRLRAGALPFAQRAVADWVAEIRNRRRLLGAVPG